MKIQRAFVPCLAILALVSSSCTWLTTQRWPEPMNRDRDELPPGELALHPAGVEEVTVLRHADPVRVRHPGALSSFPLNFYDKSLRASAGTSVLTSYGGRAEVLWPSGASVVLFGKSVGWIGSPSRGEPAFELQEVERAQLDLRAGDQVRLVGGAILSGESGPYAIERLHPGDVQRVINQSKGPVKIAFREEVFELGPGQKVDIPLLSAGGDPIVGGPDLRRLSVGRFNLRVSGPLEPVVEGNTVNVSSAGMGQLVALGVRVRLGAGERALLSGLGSPPRSAPPSETGETGANGER
jgi:hypothetical protein